MVLVLGGFPSDVVSHADFLGLRHTFLPYLGEDCVTRKKKLLRGRLFRAILPFYFYVLVRVPRRAQCSQVNAFMSVNTLLLLTVGTGNGKREK